LETGRGKAGLTWDEKSEAAATPPRAVRKLRRDGDTVMKSSPRLHE
jgi:hypothetical protein